MHVHVVDGKDKHVQVLDVMAKTIRCGWYRQAIIEREDGVERVVKSWVNLVDGRRVVVEDEGWGSSPGACEKERGKEKGSGGRLD
jgi:hypothetical protein